MGARHSKRSMDVTSTPKKEGLSTEGGDTPTIGDGKLERIEEIDAKPTTNGVAPHIDTPEEKEIKDKDSATEKEKDKNGEETKEVEETKVDTQAETPTEGGENVTTPTEETVASPTSPTSPETKESKKKDKPKKKWSFRSISFSKKDKNKPVREETPKNGDVSKDEPLTEGGEDAENVGVVAAVAAAATAAAPEVNGTEEKTPSTSPTESSPTPVVEAKEDDKSALSPPPSSSASEVAAEASSIDDKNEATMAAPSSPIAPTPVPVEAKNDEAEKEEIEKKTVEVSPVQAVAIPVEVTTHTQTIVTPSIIERKTSEEFHSLFPSSPPPTPIDPSPLQKAQQAAANADALAEALNFPAQTIKQSQNNSCVANDQKNSNSNSIIESSENVIENHPIVDEKSLNIPDVQENVSELRALEEQNEQQSTLLSAAILQPDLIIQTEEGPIPVSNTDIEVEIESVTKIADKVIEKIIDQVSDTPSKIINYDDEMVMDTDNLSVDENLLENEIINDINFEKNEDDIPPPLPESPVPMPKTTADLLSFMTSQIQDSPSTTSTTSEMYHYMTPVSATISNADLQQESRTFSKMVAEIISTPRNTEDLPLPPPEVAAYEIIQQSIISNSETPIDDLLTPPLSPIPTIKQNHAVVECAPLIINGHDNHVTVENPTEQNIICETRLESMKQNNPDTNNDDTMNNLKDRLVNTIEMEEENAATMVSSCPLTHHVEKDEQSIVETEAPIEKNAVISDSLTETIEDVPKNVIAEAPVSPSSKGPMITEDVASVTKAVEEIDINEKAVAAAVNENIECITKNEIIAEMNHQNNLNE